MFKPKRISVIAILVATLLAFLVPGSTLGCIPVENDVCQTTNPKTALSGAPTQSDSPVALSASSHRATLQRDLNEFINKNNGAAPLAPPLAPPEVGNPDALSAIVPQDAWVYISPKETIWFRVGETLRNLAIGMEVGNEAGLELSVYSPEQGDVFNASPIGQGTPDNGFDLWWSGASRGKGPWFLRFKNQNDYSIPFKLLAKAKTDSGIEYVPEVSFAFGTGSPAEIVSATNNNPLPPAPTPAALHVPAPAQPGSADPFNAPAPSGQQFFLPPNSKVWYAVSDRARRLSIWMDADRNIGLDMAIYGPDRTDVWSGKPTGRGAPGQGHAFFWTGRSRFKGIWRIRITNPNDFSVPYTLTAQNISDKAGDACRDCHGAPQEDQWDSCEHEGTFCEDLRDEAGNRD